MNAVDICFNNAIVGNDASVLQDIHSKSKNIAIFKRDIGALKNELEQLSDHNINCRVQGSSPEILQSLVNYFDHNLSQCPGLLADVSLLLKQFVNTTGQSTFRLLLASIDSDMCRKFHTDINDLRLLCTYIGPGTVWLPDDAIDYKAVQKGAEGTDMIKDGWGIQQVATGDAVILKGALYPDANPIMHKSPTIKKEGLKRLLLRIDTNTFLKF